MLVIDTKQVSPQQIMNTLFVPDGSERASIAYWPSIFAACSPLVSWQEIQTENIPVL